MKRIFIITAILLILALALTACGGDEKKETVYDILEDAINKTIESKKSDSTSVWEAALEGGSIEEVFTYNDKNIPLKTLTGKTYFGKESYASLLTMALSSGEKTDFSIFADKEKLVLLSSAFNGAYGATPSEFVKFISQYLLGTPEAETTDTTVSFTALTDGLKKHEKELDTLFKTYIPLTMNEAESSLTFNFTFSNTTLKQLCLNAIVILENDADFKKALLDYANANVEPITMAELNQEIASLKEDLNELDQTPFNATATITATKERIITNASVTVNEGATPAGKQLARVLFSLPVNGGFNVEATIEGQSFSASYTVTEFGSVTKESLSIGAMGVSLTPLNLTYDSANGDYELKIDVTGTFSATIKGNYTASKKEATLTVSSVKVNLPTDYSDIESILGGIGGNTIDLPMNLTITAKAKDTAPKAPASYTELSSLSNEEVTEIMDALSEDPAFAQLIDLLDDLFGSNVESFPDITE